MSLYGFDHEQISLHFLLPGRLSVVSLVYKTYFQFQFIKSCSNDGLRHLHTCCVEDVGDVTNCCFGGVSLQLLMLWSSTFVAFRGQCCLCMLLFSTLFFCFVQYIMPLLIFLSFLNSILQDMGEGNKNTFQSPNQFSSYAVRKAYQIVLIKIHLQQ